MGGVAVLHPQDVLNFNRMPLISPPSSKDSLKSRGRNSNRRKKSPQKKRNDVSRSPPPKGETGLPLPPKGLEMGKVKILKRGEALTSEEKKKKDVAEKEKKDLESIEMLLLSRLGPEPEMVPKQIRLAADFYAGSAFDASPPPSSLPVPEFFFKKRTPEVDFVKKSDDSILIWAGFLSLLESRFRLAGSRVVRREKKTGLGKKGEGGCWWLSGKKEGEGGGGEFHNSLTYKD